MSDRSRQILLDLQRRLAAARRRLTLGAVARGTLVLLAVIGALGALALAAEAGWWMGSGLRTALAWLIGLSALALLVAGVIVPVLRALGVLPGLGDRDVASRAGKDFTGVDDRLHAFLDLASGHGASSPEPLRDAALISLGRDVETVPFERVRSFEGAKRLLPWALAPLLLLAGLFAIAPTTFSSAAERLMAPGRAFFPPAPYALEVEPGDVSLVRGEPLEITVRAVGTELPATATLEVGRKDERALETVRLRVGSDGRFSHTLPGVSASLRYRILTDDTASPWYTATAESRPLVRGVRIRVTPPGYSGRSSRLLPEGVGDATGLAGSTVRVSVGLGGAPAAEGWLRIAWQSGDVQRIPLRIGSDGALGQFALRGAGTYSVQLETAAGLANLDPAVYSLGVLSDAPPQITLMEGGTGSLSASSRPMRFRITDDFGFSGASLVWRIAERRNGRATGFQRTGLGARTRPLDQEIGTSWRVPGAQPGDVVELYGEVRDNRAGGVQTARTAVITLRFPSVAEEIERIGAERDSTQDALEQLQEDAERSGERFEKLRQDLREQPEADWEDRRQVDQLMQEQTQLREQAQQLKDQMQSLTEQMRDSGALDDETLRQLDQMQQVMDEIESPQLQQTLERLRDAMENLDLREMLETADEAARREENFRKRLERAQRLMERLETAVELEESARLAEDLAEREEQIAEDTEALLDTPPPDGETEPQDGETPPEGEPSPQNTEAERERIADEQRQAAEDAEALQEQMEEIRESMREMGNMPQQQMQEAMQEMQEDGGLPEQMEQNADQVEQNQLQQAQEQQQDMAQKLRKMAQEMREQSSQMQGQQRQVDTAAIRRALEDVLTLSRDQEALGNETSLIPARNPALVPVARRQSELRIGLQAVSDTLDRVSQTVPAMRVEVMRRADDAQREMQLALTRLGDRQSAPAYANQKTAMSHLNELALLLSDLLDQMDPSGSGSGSGGGASEQMGEMGQQQSQLNQRIQNMLNEAAGERLSRDGEAQARQLADQQERIRRQLRDLLENGSQAGGDGGGLSPAERSALRRVEEQMAETARELRRGRMDPRTPPRQAEILQKLLETERSVNQRGQEQKREAETGRQRDAADRPRRLRAGDRPADQVRRDLIRALESGYSEDYQDLIKQYFERLQGRYE
ncbi:MAG: hypothetical protein Rubg2KO_05770 [Rubricoccaceae bacterium]